MVSAMTIAMLISTAGSMMASTLSAAIAGKVTTFFVTVIAATVSAGAAVTLEQMLNASGTETVLIMLLAGAAPVAAAFFGTKGTDIFAWIGSRPKKETKFVYSGRTGKNAGFLG